MLTQKIINKKNIPKEADLQPITTETVVLSVRHNSFKVGILGQMF